MNNVECSNIQRSSIALRENVLSHNFENLMQLFDDIRKLRNQSNPPANEIANKRKYAMLLFVLIKKVNRNEKYKIRSKRDDLQMEKVRVDNNRLQLQNLLYEINHLKREIRRCYNFRSGDEDLNLLPKESYLKLLGLDMASGNTPLKRQTLLECELKLRKQLSTEYKELIVLKKQIFQEIVSKIELLSSFAPALQNLIKATRPLQESLQLPLDQEWKMEQLVQLLPQPLYLAYMNSYSLGEAYNSEISVTVVGCESLVNEMEHSGHVAQLKESIRMKVEENVDIGNKEKLFEPHPLSLQFLIGDSKSGDGYLVINIWYFPKLHTSTAESKIQITETDTDLIPSRDILKYLYENDTGEVTETRVELVLKKNEIPTEELENYLKANNYGKTYRWLQRMCGIKVLDDKRENANIKIRQYIEETLNLIRKNWLSRLNLYKQIRLLMQKNIESFIPDENIPATPPSCSLVQWASITFEEYAANSVTARYINLNILNESNVFYRSVIVRGSAKMECTICISNKFPSESPLWSMCVHWNGQYNSTNNTAIKVMENWTNSLEASDLKNPMSLLPAQLIRTMHSFDVFLETESLNIKPSEFLKEKPFIKAFSKRIRLRPFRFASESTVNLFKQ